MHFSVLTHLKKKKESASLRWKRKHTKKNLMNSVRVVSSWTKRKFVSFWTSTKCQTGPCSKWTFPTLSGGRWHQGTAVNLKTVQLASSEVHSMSWTAHNHHQRLRPPFIRECSDAAMCLLHRGGGNRRGSLMTHDELLTYLRLGRHCQRARTSSFGHF